MKNSLPRSEWLFAILFSILLATFVLIAKVKVYRTSFALVPDRKGEFLVTIEGAVKKAGVYTVPLGTTVKEVLQKAQPISDADLSGLSLDEVIEAPLYIDIKELKEIRVKVFGAVKEAVELLLPPRSRISDLKSKIILTDEAEKSFFRSRKLLKNGDEIEVPKKPIE